MTDLLTLDEAKRALRISAVDPTDDDLVAGYIAAVSQLIDRVAGHTIASTITGEVHDGSTVTGRGTRERILLAHRPVLSIAEVTERVGVDTTVLVPETATQPGDWLADRYAPDPGLMSGWLRRRAGGCDSCWAAGRQNIAVTYTAGRVQTVADVDPRFKRAAAITLQNLWRDREPSLEQLGEFDTPRASFPTFALPNAARQLLSEEIGQNLVFGIA